MAYFAGGDGLGVANGDLAVQFATSAMASTLVSEPLGANDHEVVDEHVLTRVGVDEFGGLSVVHGALGGRDEHVDGGTGAHLLDKVARRLKLRVGKRGAGLVGRAPEPRAGPSRGELAAKTCSSTAFFLEEDLAEPASEPAGSGRLVARAASKAKAGDSGSRKRDKNRGVKPYRTYSTLSDLVPGHPTAGFNLQSDYTLLRIMIVRNYSPQRI